MVDTPNVSHIARKIANGHAYTNHAHEFSGVKDKDQFAQHIDQMMKSGIKKQLSRGRVAYWYGGTVVITNPNNPDGGTAFRPSRGREYFNNLR